MEKKMGNEMETWRIIRIKELNLSYYIGKTYYLLYIYIHIMVTQFKFLSSNPD